MHLLPHLLPFLPPGEWSITLCANLDWQILFLHTPGHLFQIELVADEAVARTPMQLFCVCWSTLMYERAAVDAKTY